MITASIEKRGEISVRRTEQSRLETVDFQNLTFGKTFSDHMFIADCVNGQWLDQRIEPYGDITISPALSALHYGQTIFEGMKAYRAADGGAILFRLKDHLARLNRSAARLCMTEIPENVFMPAIRELVGVDRGWIPEGGELYLRPLYFATGAQLGVVPSQSYRLLIFTSPVSHYYSGKLKVWVESEQTRAAAGGIGSVKTAGNYARSMQAGRNAAEKGFSVPLWLDAKEGKYIEEYSTMNAFFVIDGKIVTPRAGGTILEGITRDSMLTLLRDAGYDVEERPVAISEVMEAGKAGKLEEAFGAGTAAVAAPVERIHYKGEEIQLSEPENWKVLPWIRSQLSGIRSGKIEDTRGWVERI